MGLLSEFRPKKRNEHWRLSLPLLNQYCPRELLRGKLGVENGLGAGLPRDYNAIGVPHASFAVKRCTGTCYEWL